MTKQKIFRPGTIKQIDREKKEITFVVSDGQVDRHGDSLNPNGWQIENYMKNPVVLFGHNYKDLPVGKTLKIWVENGQEVLARMKFAKHDFAKKVWDLIEGEFLNATSVGFIPLKLDEEGQYTWSNMELLEISVVPVPANPRALGKKELIIIKSLEEESGEPILEKSLKKLIKIAKEVEKTEETPTEELHETPEKAKVDEVVTRSVLLTEDELKELIEGIVKNSITLYLDQQSQSEKQEQAKAETATKEALIAMRELLKSSDKSTELALKKLKEIVE